jgi:hypothetical protein
MQNLADFAVPESHGLCSAKRLTLASSIVSMLVRRSSQACAKCHSDHNGLNFPIKMFDPKPFHHRQTGYALEGKHAGLEYTGAHFAERTPAHSFLNTMATLSS